MLTLTAPFGPAVSPLLLSMEGSRLVEKPEAGVHSGRSQVATHYNLDACLVSIGHEQKETPRPHAFGQKQLDCHRHIAVHR
jgi:hypothetical protein